MSTLTPSSSLFLLFIFPAAVCADSSYEIVDLTTLAEPLGVVQAEARGVNEAGQAVGFEGVAAFIGQAILWDADGTPQLLARLPKDNSNLAIGIAEDGTVLGQSVHVTFEQQGEQTLVFEDKKATLWGPGGVTNLNDLVSSGAEAVTLHFTRDANSAGQIVGYAGLDEGPPFFSNGFLLDDGHVTDLGLLERPEAINNAGQVVGSTQGSGATAYLWDGGVLTNLGDHPSIVGTNVAYDINDAGLIVGEAKFSLPGPEEPALWLNGVPTRLVPEFSRPQGVAIGVNTAGQVIGWYNDLDELNSEFIGFVWQDGKRVPLLDLVDPEEGWEVLFPFDISDAGVIVGGGRRNGVWGRAFIMRPVGACVGDVDGNGTIGFPDLLALLSAWGPCPGCSEDLDEDDTVGFVDLLIMLGSWGPCR